MKGTWRMSWLLRLAVASMCFKPPSLFPRVLARDYLLFDFFPFNFSVNFKLLWYMQNLPDLIVRSLGER